MGARTAICIVAAVLLHGVLLLFGGILFLGGEEAAASKRDVELVDTDLSQDKTPEEVPPEPPKELRPPEEQPPDAAQAARAPESVGDPEDRPALDAASLSAIEAALNGGSGAGGGGDFGGAASLASGGRIGGTGRADGGGGSDAAEGAFSIAEIDQRPRPIHQVGGVYPSEMRQRNVEGSVTVIFIVDESGRVVNPRVEKSSHPEFEAPALDAVRQWRFEPAMRGGKRVSCRMRVPMRFQPK
ncbi:MAG: energy transducer TonB [Phycisphaerales bacterium]